MRCMVQATPLKLELARQDRTVTWLADEINVERTVVSRWVNGHRTPKVADAFAVARALNTTVEDLFHDETAAAA